jgi:putative ABC transport system permease protein
MENDFFIGTKESYMALWRSISTAFFAVFIMVSAISVIIGGIVIMNVMLMSVTARRREIGVRRAVGATKLDIMRQFIAESVVQCIAGGLIGISLGFLVALARPYAFSLPCKRAWPCLDVSVLRSDCSSVSIRPYARPISIPSSL